MSESYANQLFNERTEERKLIRPKLQCFLNETAPTFEFCKRHFEEQGMLLSQVDYEDMCAKVGKRPQYE